MSQSKTDVENHEENADLSFVSRWSRRKHEASSDIDKSGNDKPVATDISDGVQEPAGKILTDADMPDIDSLTPASDYTDFLSPGVSEALRKLALRKLFSSEVFNIRDGLDEYDDDFTQFEALGDLVTSDMKHQLELEAKRKAEQMLEQEQLLPGNTSVELEADDNDNVQDDNKVTEQQQITTEPNFNLDLKQNLVASDDATDAGDGQENILLDNDLQNELKND